MLFKDLGLSAELLRAVDEAGYREATPIQQRAVPAVLEGRDVLGSAQTGTGKTAGFMLPLLERLKSQPYDSKRRRPRALVLTPTRELAAQVGQSARDYGRYLRSKTAIVYGGVGIHPQIAALRAGADIVVATPGRLLDHLEQRTVDLSGIEILVLDEADRMLDMGFIRDIRKILDTLPERRQNLLFSATFSAEIRRLAADLLHAPVEIEATPRNTAAERVRQIAHPVDKARKRALLAHLIAAGNWRQVLVFTRTKHGANRLAEQLERDGLGAAAIHGNKSQAARTRALADFKSGKVRVLVATDLAARGLDIDRLPHVVNYELPNVPEDYLHRIGRTARAGQDGTAVSLVCVDELGLLAGVERLLKGSVARAVVPGFEVDPRIRAEPIEGGRASRGNRPRAGAASRNAGSGAARPARGGEPRPGGGARRPGGGKHRSEQGSRGPTGAAKPAGAGRRRSQSRKRRVG